MIRVACAIIKNAKNEVLCVQRSEKMRHPLQWEFPGGKLMGSETVAEAVVRELKEELDLEVVAKQECPAVDWEYPDKKIVLIPIICEIGSGNLLLKEHLEARWLAIEEMKKMNVLEADRLIIQQLEGAT